ncbi:MAG: hypothetical protein J1E41_05130, partial [Ruminococcus sp.]|nr:hypothetical protein [Ruminococcus sp.]
MKRTKHEKKQIFSANNVLYRTVGILFICTMLSVWLFGGLHAKYIVADKYNDSATVEGVGVTAELYEHRADKINDADEAVKKDGVYELAGETVDNNKYDVVLPGVDI